MRASLFWKLGLTYLILVLLVLAAFDFYVARILRQDYIRAADDQLSSLAQVAKSRPPDFENSSALASWASWMAHSGARITVIAADGRVLADSAHDITTMESYANRPEFIQAMAKGQGESVRHSHTLDRDLVYYAIRSDRAGASPVIIRVALPLAEINTALAKIRFQVWTASFLTLILGIVVSAFFSRGFTRRVARLKDFSRQVAAGDFRPLPREPGNDELVDLADALNETAAQVNRMIRTLTEERNRSAAILRSMVEGIAVVDFRERLVFCNEAFGKIWEVNSAEFEGRPAVEVIRHPEIIELLRKVLAEQQVFRGEISSGAARPRIFSVIVAPVASLDGAATAQPPTASLPGAVVVLHEITELRRLEQVRKDFVANVSHELRTPLTAVQGFAETLLSGALDDPKNNRHFVEIIRSHAARLARLTEDLLRLSRIEAGKVEIDFQPIDPRHLIEVGIEAVRLAASQKQISIGAVRLARNLPRVRGDAGLLGEVLRNLLDNAIQYTSASGRIEVTAEASGEFVVITVADTGIGIPQNEQSRIFERFYRVDAARSREVGGTGLGLAIAKHIVEAHGGRIWVESVVGEGSKFRFSVPRA
ncbi:MAG TPA: ATP-binding protein [Candidatus Acidoferrales bacterium]|nr:ATP-binding protein [Candidatus Acidoferrales bacterium]